MNKPLRGSRQTRFGAGYASLQSLKVFAGGVFLVCGSVCIQAQQTREKWQRVYTSEAFVTEINDASLRLGPGRLLQIQSRTVMSDPVRISGSTGPKYKSTVQEVEFKLNEAAYRILETIFLDSSGKVLETVGATDWRVLKEGGVMESVLSAACSLQPFGSWKITTYRYAEGNPAQRAPELEKLVGKQAKFCSNCAEIDSLVCSDATFQDRRYTSQEFASKLGFLPGAIGINTEAVESIEVTCEVGQWKTRRSLLIKVGEHEMLMLWDGVFLVLKRERHWLGVPPSRVKIPPGPRIPRPQPRP